MRLKRHQNSPVSACHSVTALASFHSIQVNQLQKIAPRMHKNSPFWAHKSKNFLPPPQTSPPVAKGTPRSPHPTPLGAFRALILAPYGARLHSRLLRSTSAPTAPRPQGRLPRVLWGPSDASAVSTLLDDIVKFNCTFGSLVKWKAH